MGNYFNRKKLRISPIENDDYNYAIPFLTHFERSRNAINERNDKIERIKRRPIRRRPKRRPKRGPEKELKRRKIKRIPKKKLKNKKKN